MIPRFLIAVISVLMVSAAVAQESQRTQTFTVRGEVSTMRPLIGGYMVELTRSSGMKESVPLSADGSFEFRAAQDGMQELRVIDPSGAVIHREPVVINGPHQLLAIRLPESPNTNTPRSGMNTVSAQQLQHKVPPMAKKAFDRGQQAAAAAKYQDAILAFREAVTIDPEYADCFNELGVAEAATGDLEHAAEEFQKAIDVAPEHPMALPNLSIVLAKLRRFHEAAQVARRALKIVPDSARVRYILAASILVEHGDPEEALQNLERASSEIPKAHLVAADVLIVLHRNDDAIRHLEEFLRNAPPDDQDREAAEERLAALRR
jgi:tetratricopeptide (TPR) repeat protein